MTHFISYNAPRLGTQARAICGALTLRRDHANDPTCPECVRLRAEDEPLTAAEKFGDESDTTPPAVVRVTSSTIATLRFVDGELRIEFRTGAVYAYYGVPPATYAALVAAPSIGKHYSTHIRGQFRSEKLQAAPARPVRGFEAFEESHAEN